MGTTKYETPAFGILETVAASQRPGENLFETASRLLVNEALSKTYGDQAGAARMLRVSRRIMNYRCKDFRLRPMDTRRERYLKVIYGGAR